MNGPVNSYEILDDSSHLKLGSVWVPIQSGLDVSAEVNQETGELVSVSLHFLDSIVKVQVFAAAKDSDSWAETRYEIASRLEDTKVQPKIVIGNFGPEIQAVMPTYDSAGQVTIQSVRFIGVNGDRWFARIVVSGLATLDQGAMNKIDQLISELVIHRGDQAMAPGTLLPLEFPEVGKV